MNRPRMTPRPNDRVTDNRAQFAERLFWHQRATDDRCHNLPDEPRRERGSLWLAAAEIALDALSLGALALIAYAAFVAVFGYTHH